MSTRSRSPSVFRPAKGVDQSALEENEALVADINRRNVLRGALSLGALSFLTGCDVSDTSAVRSMLLAVSAWKRPCAGIHAGRCHKLETGAGRAYR